MYTRIDILGVSCQQSETQTDQDRGLYDDVRGLVWKILKIGRNTLIIFFYIIIMVIDRILNCLIER